jgi:hypothetical protein
MLQIHRLPPPLRASLYFIPQRAMVFALSKKSRLLPNGATGFLKSTNNMYFLLIEQIE